MANEERTMQKLTIEELVKAATSEPNPLLPADEQEYRINLRAELLRRLKLAESVSRPDLDDLTHLMKMEAVARKLAGTLSENLAYPTTSALFQRRDEIAGRFVHILREHFPAKELVASRNKWHILCYHFSLPPYETSVTTISDRLEAAESRVRELERQLADLNEQHDALKHAVMTGDEGEYARQSALREAAEMLKAMAAQANATSEDKLCPDGPPFESQWVRDRSYEKSMILRKAASALEQRANK